MDRVAEAIRNAGRVAHRSTILAAGVSSFELGRAVHSGMVFRVRRAWYATPDAPPALVRAVRVGGALTSVSTARMLGLWIPPGDDRVHVSVAQNASRLRSENTRFVPLAADAESDVCVHWRRASGASTEPVESMAATLVHAVECQPEENAVVLIDSALEKELATAEELRQAFRHLPRRYRRALAKSDGASQSGTETIARLRLRALGVALRIQVPIHGVGRVDILIGDRLIVECDSRQWHWTEEGYERDRARDLALIERGYIVIRLSYRMIMEEWDRAERVIRAVIARQDHLWSRRAS